MRMESAAGRGGVGLQLGHTAARMTRRTWIFAAVVALVVVGRLITAYQYNVPAVDGRQYLALADELRLHGRYAFSSREPPTYSRLPGYPWFLRLVASGAENPVRRAALANVFCDLATALLLGFWARRRLGERAAVATVLVVLSAPLLVILASHALTETSATTLGVAELVLALLGAASGSLGLVAGAGVAAGLGQLWRADALTVLPAAVLAIALGGAPLRRRLLQLALFAGVALAVYAPWPIRNLAVLGQPYPFAWQWRTAGGKPLPTGVVRWARTWTRCDVSEYSLDPLLAFERPLPSPLPIPWSASSEDERQELKRVLDRYNQERLSPAVDAGFEALADRRWREHPALVLALPFLRVPAMFRSVPSGELSINAPLFGLIHRRPWVVYYDLIVYLVAAAGLVRIFGRDRRLAVVLASLVGARLAVLAATVPLGLSQRHLVQIFPWLLLCAIAAIWPPQPTTPPTAT